MDIHIPAAYASLLWLCFLLPLKASTRPGCPTQCGNLIVPFPFGLGSNCSIHPAFDVHCNTSANPPKAYLKLPAANAEITKLNGSQIWVKYPTLAVTCYGSMDYQRGGIQDFVINVSSTPYTLSDNNWVTAVGCDDFVSIRGNDFGGGCLLFCAEGSSGNGSCSDYDNGYSPGNGCCHTTIPKGTTTLVTHLSDLQGNWRKSKLFPCSYSFVGEKGLKGFTYPLDGLRNPTTFVNENLRVSSTALVLDWRIGTQNCSQGRRNSSEFGCKENSTCVDYGGRVGGYICRCSEGYVGNPYLTGAAGCQDINECANQSTNPCAYICMNTLGGYNCSCPKGYHGDGKKSGIGCIRLPESKIITVSIGLASGIGFILLVAICIWSLKLFQSRKKKKLREKFFKRNGGLLLQQTNEGTAGKKNHFPAKELEKATDHFNENRIIGQGGQGTVYKGMLSNGKIVAIKKSKMINQNQLDHFINEVVILSQINHKNVVKLLGFCLETEVPLLVYEFVPNGTLSQLIHDGNTEFPISWNMRLKIAADIAGALAYLHSASSVPIYHRDIKSSNILLDEKYVAKVSDFGTSKLVAVDQTHLTTQVKGTFGYFDPEYFQTSRFTEKSDVYSFGVVLVELLTGQRPISNNTAQEARSLTARFLLSVETNSLDTILEVIVLEQGRSEEVSAVARLAYRCLNLKGEMRPTMKEVATELESIRMSQVPLTIEVESRKGKQRLPKAVLFSDSEYSWTTSDNNATTSSREAHPLMLETV